MTRNSNSPRIVLLSQWPNAKNGEYELIEKLRQTGYKIAVVDFLGFDVDTGKCINEAALSDEYDFAISFHYFTPKFLTIPTFLWVANPLEFMHLLPDYRDVIIHHLRSYDDYLYNGSDLLKEHIKQVVGSEWQDTGLQFFASCSRKALLEPRLNTDQKNETFDKIFYCGINWERGADRSVGRAHGLLDILQERQAADFYGPRELVGVNTWEGFTSYRGEIPFDGVSISRTMRDYGAVLAVSSPAHMKSQTSSSRVFEGFAAGVPVISDENPHVKHLFGDLVYYFRGTTEQERAESILSALDSIRSNPSDAIERVRRAQAKISEIYCFETCLTRALGAVTGSTTLVSSVTATASKESPSGPTIDIFLFYHDPDTLSGGQTHEFLNITHILKAASVAIERNNAKVRIFYCDPNVAHISETTPVRQNLEWIALNEQQFKLSEWEKLRFGEKVARLANSSTGDFAVFLTQSDCPQYDYFIKPLDWFKSRALADQRTLYIGGFFVNDLSEKAPSYPAYPMNIININASVGLYRWSQKSKEEHQLGQLCFSRDVMKSLDFARLSRFDVLFPVAVILEAVAKNMAVNRARHVLLRVEAGYFRRYHKVFSREVEKGFWAQHYNLLSHYSHELNALYDAFHEFPDIVAIADQVSGYGLSDSGEEASDSGEKGYTAANLTNKEWVKGVAKDWATAFYLQNTSEARRDFAVGTKVTFADGSIRAVVRNQVNGINLMVFLDGTPLNGDLVGYPKPIKPNSENDSIERSSPLRPIYRFLRTLLRFDWRSKKDSDADCFFNVTDQNWVNGVARDWATAFFVANSDNAQSRFTVGKKIKFVDGTIRAIVSTQENGGSLTIFLDGDPLDGAVVGYPHKFSVHK